MLGMKTEAVYVFSHNRMNIQAQPCCKASFKFVGPHQIELMSLSFAKYLHLTVFLYPTENSSEPFGASVIIDGVTYGTGTASSKKLAKNKAGNPSHLLYFTVHCSGCLSLCNILSCVLAQEF